MSTPEQLRENIENLISSLGLVEARSALSKESEMLQEARENRDENLLADPPSPKVLNGRAQMWPTLSRSLQEWVEEDGRVYGKTSDPRDQKQSDAGFWRVSKTVRDQYLPLIVAEGGTVVRAWGVDYWELDEEGGKWVAELSRELTNDELRELHSPFLIGDDLPTLGTRAYWPVAVDIDGRVYRGGKLIKVWDPSTNSFQLAGDEPGYSR